MIFRPSPDYTQLVQVNEMEEPDRRKRIPEPPSVNNETGEVYKDVVGWEGLYIVSNFGKIYSLKTNIMLRGQMGAHGYLIIQLCTKGKVSSKGRHRIIAEAFIPNPLEHPQINHINGIKTDNRIENLEWCTAKHNIQHAVDTGLSVIVRGERNGGSKLTESDVIAIRASKKGCVRLGREYGVCPTTIWNARSRTNWKHLQ